MNKLILFVVILSLTYLTVYAIPSQQKTMALEPEISYTQPWRFITYQFAHLDLSHLIQNILGLIFTVLIAKELKVDYKKFSRTYLAAGMFAILPLWFFFPFTAIGASVAIFAGLSLAFFYSGRYKIKPYNLLALLTVVIFSQTLYSIIVRKGIYNALLSDTAHFSGVIFGSAAYFILLTACKKREAKKYTVLKTLGE